MKKVELKVEFAVIVLVLVFVFSFAFAACSSSAGQQDSLDVVINPGVEKGSAEDSDRAVLDEKQAFAGGGDDEDESDTGLDFDLTTGVVMEYDPDDFDYTDWWYEGYKGVKYQVEWEGLEIEFEGGERVMVYEPDDLLLLSLYSDDSVEGSNDFDHEDGMMESMNYDNTFVAEMSGAFSNGWVDGWYMSGTQGNPSIGYELNVKAFQFYSNGGIYMMYYRNYIANTKDYQKEWEMVLASISSAG